MHRNGVVVLNFDGQGGGRGDVVRLQFAVRFDLFREVCDGKTAFHFQLPDGGACRLQGWMLRDFHSLYNPDFIPLEKFFCGMKRARLCN
jgi:hypothetical protein